MRYVFSTKETKRYRYPTHINDLVMDRAESATAEAFLLILAPGEVTPGHTHEDAEQLFYVLRGEGRLGIGEDQKEFHPVKAGDLIRIPLSTWHRIYCGGDSELVFLAVDCFLGGRPAAEPTWEAHARALCRDQGWDFEAIAGHR
jgi:quercetin dioxygenase-like cupin family protein